MKCLHDNKEEKQSFQAAGSTPTVLEHPDEGNVTQRRHGESNYQELRLDHELVKYRLLG